MESPVSCLLTKPRRSIHIVRIDQIHSLTPQGPPHRISRTHRPSWQIPIPHSNALAPCHPHLGPQPLQLRTVEGCPVHGAKLRREIRARYRTDQTGYIGECTIQHRQRRIVEVISPAGHVLDLVQWRVACSDDGDGTIGYGRAVYGREIAGAPERVQGAHDVWPGGGSWGLDVDPQVDCLAAKAVEDTISCGARGES